MDFQVAISTSVDADYIIINDVTPYANITTDGEQKADFSGLYKVKILSGAGYSYSFSSVGDGDADIATPSEAASPEVDHELPYLIDGSYTATIIAVPTYDATVTYAVGKHIYLSGVIYKCLLEALNKAPATETTYWEVVDEDDLTSVYKVEYQFAVTYHTQDGFEYFTTEACNENVENIGANFLQNRNWEKAARLDNMISAVGVYETAGNFDACDHILAAAKVITDTIPA